MILALNWITDRFCLQITTRVSNQPSRHAVPLESLCKLTVEHMAGNNAYLCMSARRSWVWIDPAIATLVCAMNMDLLRRSLNKPKIFFFFLEKLRQNAVKWNGYFSHSGAERLSCRPSFAWNCLQPNYCWLLWSRGVGGGGCPLTFFYGDHGGDISTRVMFQRTHARPWVLNCSLTVELLVSGRFVLGKAFSDQAKEKVSPSHAVQYKHGWQEHQRLKVMLTRCLISICMQEKMAGSLSPSGGFFFLMWISLVHVDW